MNHDDVLICWLSGDTPPPEAISHMESCHRCRAELAGLKAVESSVAAAAPEWSPAAVRAAGACFDGSAGKWGSSLLALAAALVLCACLGTAWLAPSGPGAAGADGPHEPEMADWGSGTVDILDACQAQFETFCDENQDDPGRILGDPGDGG